MIGQSKEYTPYLYLWNKTVKTVWKICLMKINHNPTNIFQLKMIGQSKEYTPYLYLWNKTVKTVWNTCQPKSIIR